MIKMNAIRLVYVICLGMLMGSPLARADFIIAVDFDPLASGIQEAREVQAGQAFSAYIVLEYDDVLGLDSYWFSVEFDPLGMVGVSASDMPLADFSRTADPPSVFMSKVSPFAAEAIAIQNGPSSVGQAIVGQIDFIAGVMPGQYQIMPFEDSMFDASYNSNFDQIFPSFGAGTVTVIPEPGWFVGTLLMVGVICVRVRRKMSRE